MGSNNDDRPVMVTIQCMAYNQEKYIRQCLDGFVMQKANFRFEAIVHDDASTDRTATIIMEYAERYPEVIKPLIETENQYSKRDGSLSRIMAENTMGKYVAICEGDDFWIDPLKLQKQVDFLETHLDYGLVHTNRYNLIGEKFSRIKASGKSDAISILVRTGIATVTTCFRSDLYFRYLKDVELHNKSWLMGDSPLWKYIAFHSKVKLMPDYTSVYRIIPGSASHSQSFDRRISFTDSILDIQKYMLERYVTNPYEKKKVESQIVSDYHLRYFITLLSFGKKSEAKSYLINNWKNIKKCDLLSFPQLKTIIPAMFSIQ